jgi:prepilin signal peptidase PulO-like enzyme (type II secretory pathway)
MKKFRMTKEAIMTWSWPIWVFFFCVAAGIVFLLYKIAFMYASVGTNLAWYYGAAYLLLNLIIIAITCIRRKTHDLHIHHYSVGLALAVFFAYPAHWVSIVHGFGNGMLVEGGSTYGYDPTWKKKELLLEKESKTSEQIP